MSDDLISRKAVIEAVDRHTREDGTLDEDISVILEEVETAFDKEEVIEELDKFTGEECTLHECGIRSERCKPCIAKKAIEIVEKGGIECEKYYFVQSG